MSSISIPAEFTLHRKISYNRTTAVRWIVSHARPYWWIAIMMVVGAVGNAALALASQVKTIRAGKYHAPEAGLHDPREK